MKCKLFALLMAALLLFVPVSAYAETMESTGGVVITPTGGTAMTYDSGSGMYTYYFGDGSGFTASADLSSGDAFTFVLMIFPNDDNVDIIITKNGELYDYDPDALISESGVYNVTVLHTHENGELETLNYSVTVQDPSEIAENMEKNTVTGRIQLTSDSGGYSCSFEGLGEVFCSVADGEFSAAAVRLTVDELLGCDITRNGESYAYPANGLFTEDGVYNAIISAVYEEGGMELRYLSFAVFTKPSAALGIYFPPYGYKLDGVLLDGEEYPFSEELCRFTRDGRYQISYNNGSEYKMTVLQRDTTPPVLYFNGGSELVFAEDVQVTTDGPCTLEIYKNGGDNIYESTTLRGNGIYRIIATDSAGNTTTARVEITAPSAINPMLFAGIGAVVLTGSLIYIIAEKKKGPVVR